MLLASRAADIAGAGRGEHEVKKAASDLVNRALEFTRGYGRQLAGLPAAK
jgi:hypothetical protein